MKIIRKPPEIAVKELLVSAQLPTDDLTSEHMENFFGAWEGSNLAGVVGIEIFGPVALLRSLAVIASKYRSGVGSELLIQVERYATKQGVRSLFLLTTTAETYFEKRGYARISREMAPDAIRNTMEFISLCPAGAVLMTKPAPTSDSLPGD